MSEVQKLGGLSRRGFLAGSAAVLALVFGDVWFFLRKANPVRIVRAIKAGRFPGRVRPFDPDEVSRPGKWQG